jgi:hypothetical protein
MRIGYSTIAASCIESMRVDTTTYMIGAPRHVLIVRMKAGHTVRWEHGDEGVNVWDVQEQFEKDRRDG